MYDLSRPSVPSRESAADFLRMASREARAVLLEVLGRGAVIGSAKAVDVAVALGERSRAWRGRADQLTDTGPPVPSHFHFQLPESESMTDEERAAAIARHPAGKGLKYGW